MWETYSFDYDDYEALDESERSYLEDVLASGDPDETERVLEYFGRDCF